MSNYLAKPISGARLAETLVRHLGTDHLADSAGATTASKAVAGANTPVFDPRFLEELPMVADGSEPEFMTQVLEQYMRSSTEIVERCLHAAEGGDDTAARLALHTLKSSASQVGACALADLAGAIEERLRCGISFETRDLERLMEVHRHTNATIAEHLRRDGSDEGGKA